MDNRHTEIKVMWDGINELDLMTLKDVTLLRALSQKTGELYIVSLERQQNSG